MVTANILLDNGYYIEYLHYRIRCIMRIEDDESPDAIMLFKKLLWIYVPRDPRTDAGREAIYNSVGANECPVVAVPPRNYKWLPYLHRSVGMVSYIGYPGYLLKHHNRVPTLLGEGVHRAQKQFYSVMEEMNCGGGIYAAHI